MIWDRFKTTQSRQKSYAGVTQKKLEFDVGDWVFLKVSPMEGVMHYEKPSPRFIGPYLISRRVENIAYELEFPSSLGSIHSCFMCPS